MYTLDTNTIIYYLKDDQKAVAMLRDIFARDIPLYISAITELELFAFSHLSEEEAERIDLILHTVSIIPIDSRIARLAGALKRTYHIKTPDSGVAATALFTGSTLITRNIRDFRKIPHLSLLEV
ncbi:MAG: type II toxin-antitoxin system VapC family toxin [Candidatus Colwellbacteria bacterium]|nr:type II toxin-antitoxin system VapC family toxin [Candidatus Colwellbacteria bacterium]